MCLVQNLTSNVEKLKAGLLLKHLCPNEKKCKDKMLNLYGFI